MPRPYKGKKPWTQADDDLLRKLHRKLSTYLIADRLGRTKNSIIGRIWRLNLSSHRSWQPEKCRPRPQQARSSKPEVVMQHRKPQSAPKPPQAPPPESVWQPLEGIQPVLFIDLDHEHCRWPVEGGYCGCQRSDGSSYCSTHRAIAGSPAPAVRMVRQPVSLSP